MKKLNNNGFVATAALYSAFIFLVIIVLAIAKIVSSQIDSTNFGSNEVKEKINHIVPYDVLLD